MKDLKWYFPDNLSAAVELFSAGNKLHGGGTFLFKSPLNTPGLIDLRHITQMNTIEITDDTIRIGANCTYTDISKFLSELDAENIFTASIGNAAATPLRNRITLGGSIHAAPKWSDITGPLLVSDAGLLINGSEASVSAKDYYSSRELRKSGIISEVLIKLSNLKGSYFRYTRTDFDYPFFTVSAGAAAEGKFNVAVTGISGGYLLYSGTPDEIIEQIDAEAVFSDERGTGAEYLKHRLMVELKRTLSKTGGDNV